MNNKVYSKLYAKKINVKKIAGDELNFYNFNVINSVFNCINKFKKRRFKISTISLSPTSNSTYLIFEKNNEEYSVRISDHALPSWSCLGYSHIYSIRSLNGKFIINKFTIKEIEENIIKKKK